MANRQKNNKTYTLSLDADLMKELDELCREERRTRSSAVELGVELYIRRSKMLKEGDKWAK